MRVDVSYLSLNFDMKKFGDDQLFWLIRILPLIFLSYFQFLSWEQGEWWSIFQWSSIITSTMAFAIFIVDMMEIAETNKVMKNTKFNLILFMRWCMVWSFAYHIFRLIREVVSLII